MAAAHPKTVVVGCGSVGRRLLNRLPKNTPCLAVSRRPATLETPVLSLDLDCDALDKLVVACEAARVYYFAPPSTDSARDDRSRRLSGALKNAGVTPAAVILISTTGVYGDCGGAWVDESRRPQPTATRSRRRVDAEQCWRYYGEAVDVPVAVLRVAGIYGPDKLPVGRLQNPQPLLREDQSPYSNRVHIDDLVDIALAVAGSDKLVNVADGAPSTMTAYFHALADAMAVARLPVATREQLATQWSDALRSYMSESRRIDNTLMRDILGGSLRYPQLAAGLAASLAERG